MAFRVPEQFRITRDPVHGTTASVGKRGAFQIQHPIRKGTLLFCIADEGTVDDDGHPLREQDQWEHVSVSVREGGGTRTPLWGEMVFVKELFWEREDCVIQFHPPRSEYVNVHPHVLHLWRHRIEARRYPTPPKWMVG